MSGNRAEQVRRVQELRRSSAARPHRDKSKYDRKAKHRAEWR